MGFEPDDHGHLVTGPNELRFFACFARKKSGWTESGRRPGRNTWSLEPSRLDPERPMDGDAGGMP